MYKNAETGLFSPRELVRTETDSTEGVAQNFLKYHTDLNVRIRTLKVLPGTVKNPPDFMKERNWNDTHTHTHPDIHTLTIVSRTHTFHCH
jgi:hypothetical protein